MVQGESIKEYCHVNNCESEETFVGIKADTNGVGIYFPIGYQLSNADDEILKDVMNLFSVLNEYTIKNDRVFQKEKYSQKYTVEFPLNAYLKVINYYFNYGYYKEYEYTYKTDSKGKVDWGKTLKRRIPLVQKDGSFIYNKMIVKSHRYSEDNLITNINKYCVYECFERIGWMYGAYLPEQANIQFNKSVFLSTLNDKLSSTFNDKNKSLFRAMIDIIEFIDERPNKYQFYFGTNRFEYVWERIIDKIFGENNKENYFPKAKWLLRNSLNTDSTALLPDTIMKYNDNIYILDAKYYKYGINGEIKSLPNTSSINKQITYGEYVNNHLGIPSNKIFNAFLLPFNSEENGFSTDKIIVNVGEATGKWRNQTIIKNYDRVQCIVIDIKTIMNNRLGKSKSLTQVLANEIEKYFG